MTSQRESAASQAGSEVVDHPLRFQSVDELARFFRQRKRHLLYVLYDFPEKRKYATWEIPKRTGGMRRIDSPIGLIRECQDKLTPHLYALHNPHPASFGFLKGRGVVGNAELHKGQRHILNVDLADFFPSINFGRIRGLFMRPPFEMSAEAATVCAQLCTFRNGLPQGASTSPILSNYIASPMDRRLHRLARRNRMRYSRYADDITFSTNAPRFPESIVRFVEGVADAGEAATAEAPNPVGAMQSTLVANWPNVSAKPAAAKSAAAIGKSASTQSRSETPTSQPVVGEALERAIRSGGFSVNPRKVRVQGRDVRQSVTGLTVNEFPNVDRRRIRRIRAMIHAWRKFGLYRAGWEHFSKHRSGKDPSRIADVARAYRNAIYGELAFIKMVRGAEDRVFLNLCAQLIDLDANPSKFVRRMVFGADDYDVFISHASEDKAEIARPIFEACEKLGVKAFLDEEHIGWGENFTSKINAALGAAPCVLVIVSNNSVQKSWPLAEINTALSLEVSGEKAVAPLVVGRPDLNKIPLIKGKDYMEWRGDPDDVAKGVAKLLATRRGDVPSSQAAAFGAPMDATSSVPRTPRRDEPPRSGLFGTLRKLLR